MDNENNEFNKKNSEYIDEEYLYNESIFAGDMEDMPSDKTSEKYVRDKKREADNSMEIYDWVQCIISALICGILLFMFAGRVIGVSGTSMLPTLMHGDRAIISNLFYTPSYGDIVIIQKDSFDDEPIVKRIIATEGQTVDIDFESGIVYVDDMPLDETYTNSLTFSTLDFSGKVTVPKNCVFVLGDNRNASNDSRDSRIGMVDQRCIIGKVYLIIYPGLDINERRDWSRLGSPY